MNYRQINKSLSFFSFFDNLGQMNAMLDKLNGKFGFSWPEYDSYEEFGKDELKLMAEEKVMIVCCTLSGKEFKSLNEQDKEEIRDNISAFSKISALYSSE